MTRIQFNKKGLKKKELVSLYHKILYPRMIEEKMLNLLRLGLISKWFSGIGQEAIAVGCTAALDYDEVIFPMHRNLGVFTGRDIPLRRLFAQWQGKTSGFTTGRDRSFHFGTMDYNIVGMISHLGPQLALADGIALANRLSKDKKVCLAFTGEGGTSEGDFHEALNVASVWKLPVIFVIENNGFGLSTPTNEQYAAKNLADRAKGYGMKSAIIDGNNILEVYTTISRVAKKIRSKPEPYLVECKTFRQRGHEEASGVWYVPEKELAQWKKKDPVQNYEDYLVSQSILSKTQVEKIKSMYKNQIQEELTLADEMDDVANEVSFELNSVYKNHTYSPVSPTEETSEMRFVDAIKDGLDVSMSRHDKLVCMGQDIALYGGVFKVTEGLMEKYGSDRVRNTPLCESAIIGTALGLALKGYKSMVEMQFADFVTCGFNQIVNNLAKIHYRWNGSADVVIRMPTGGGMGAGPFHSQSIEAWFTHVPGLKVVYPSSPYDAKGLLMASFDDPNPILFFEHKFLYRSISEEVPGGYYTEEIGKAKTVEYGEDLSIITYGMGVSWAQKAKEETGVDAEILDLRTLLPLDYEAIDQTVRKTGRVIILHEATGFGGIGGEISSYIAQNLFEYLDAPIFRCSSLDTPVPFKSNLEKQFLASSRLTDDMKALMDY